MIIHNCYGSINMKYDSLTKEEIKELTTLFVQKLTKYIESNKAKINSRQNQKIKIDKDFIQVILRELVCSYSDILKLIDLKGVSFAGIDIRNKDLSGTNADIDPQTIYKKDLHGVDLSGLDMRDKDFTGVYLVDTNLSYTNADIDPQTIYNKNLYGAILCGLDMDGKDFTGVNIKETNLSYTKANVDPQKVYDKNLWGTNLSGLDMSDKDFIDVCLIETKLNYTKANVDPQKIYKKDLTGTNLTGCTIIGRMTPDIKISSKTVLKNVTYENDYEKAKEYIKSLFN